MTVLKAAVIFLCGLLFKKGVCFDFMLREWRLAGDISVRLFFERLRVRLGFSLSYGIRRGSTLTLEGLRPISLKRKRKRKGRIRFLRGIEFQMIRACGALGFEGRPDASVIASGALQLLLSEAIAVLTKRKPEAVITPSLEKPAFVLNVEGILKLHLGRLIREIIKSKRRTK